MIMSGFHTFLITVPRGKISNTTYNIFFVYFIVVIVIQVHDEVDNQDLQ